MAADSAGCLPLDRLLDALADQNGRLVLGYLRAAADGVASFDELTAYAMDRQAGRDPEHLTIEL